MELLTGEKDVRAVALVIAYLTLGYSGGERAPDAVTTMLIRAERFEAYIEGNDE